MAFQWPLNKLLGLLISVINNRFPFHGQFHGQAARQGQAVLSAMSRVSPAETPSLSSIPGSKGQHSFPQFLRAELNSVIAMGKVLEEGSHTDGDRHVWKVHKNSNNCPRASGDTRGDTENKGTTIPGNSSPPCSQGKLLVPLLSYTSSGFSTAFNLKQLLCRWVKAFFYFFFQVSSKRRQNDPWDCI